MICRSCGSYQIKQLNYEIWVCPCGWSGIPKKIIKERMPNRTYLCKNKPCQNLTKACKGFCSEKCKKEYKNAKNKL